MGVFLSAHWHANCFNLDFKCFAEYLAWGWQPIVFTEIKAGIDRWCFTRYVGVLLDTLVFY